jgi:type I restriction enzyme S subunit
MAGGYPLNVNGVRILTSEALYQACRFPHRPDIQALIIEQKSPMTAKMKSKPYRKDSRPDWDQVRVNIMRWCLRVKLAQHWNDFSQLLLDTGEYPIVEESRKDDFWGAKATDDDTLVGRNVLGRLLMELREAVKVERPAMLLSVEPLDIPNFTLDGQPIEVVGSNHSEPSVRLSLRAEQHEVHPATVGQPSLFDVPSDRELALSEHPERIKMNEREAGLRLYPHYKESGSPWIGAVPASWEIRRMRSLITIRTQRNRADLPLLSVAREKSVFVRFLADNDENHNIIPDDLSNYKVARAGDLVINKMKAWQGSMGISPCDGIVSPAYFVFDFDMASPSFGQMLLRSKPYVAHFAQASDGVRVGQWDLSVPGMRQIPVLVPPPSEQAAIVKYLNWATGRIDRAIRAKKKIIALLNEQKQAIIHQAVTQGLDPNVRMKPSGIPWLEEIPEHWEVIRLKSICQFVTSGSRGWARYYSDNGDIFLRIGNISTTSIELRLNKITFVTPPQGIEGERTRAIPGDLLLSITAQVGAVGVVPVGLGEAYVNQHTALIRLNRTSTNPRWVAYVLLSGFGKEQCRLKTNGGTKVGLTLDDVRTLNVLMPPIEEQERIASEIDRRTASIDQVLKLFESGIVLLREYRARLVSDVVTGKVDVREAAVALRDLDGTALPDEVDLDQDVEYSDMED